MSGYTVPLPPFTSIAALISKNFWGICTLVAAWTAYSIYNIGSRDPRLPPGPPTSPVVGNMLIFPRSYLHFKFTEWAKQYGDAYSLKVMNKTVIVISSPSQMKEVIEKRAAATSNRPKSILADYIAPNNMNLGTGHLPNENWKVMRKAATQLLNKDSIHRQRHYMHAETTQTIFDLMSTPENWYRHMNRTILSFCFGITYGARIPRTECQDVKEFLAVHEQFINALELGRLPPVDLFPIMDLVPARWAGWKRTVTGIHDEHSRLYENYLARVESRLSKGLETPGFMEELIRDSEFWGMTRRELLTNFGGVLLEGSDTASASLQSVVLHLINFPDAQRKARAEIDRVVGRDRLPTPDDLANLPYTMAFVEEVNRFRPVGPLGVPHEMSEDQLIDGMLFPKDATIFVNLWGMFHDERYFDRPEEFIPERWLNNPLGVKDPTNDDPARRPNMLFGGGRRVCPGLAFAKSLMEIATAKFIWAFEFHPFVDPISKQVVIPNVNNFSSGIASAPLPFKCQIIPRPHQTCEVIRREFTAGAEHLAPFETDLNEDDRKYNATNRDF